LSRGERKPGDDHPSPGTDHQAALRVFPMDPVLAAWLNSSSSSPARTDQGVNHRRQLIPGRDDDAGLSLLELNGFGTKLDQHHHLSGWVRLPPGPDGLLLGGGLPLPVDLRPSLDGPDVVGVLQE
jgi:hypothetical protein